MSEEKKVFLIINSYFIGDMLLVNPLIQNIKRLYKDSVIVMLSSPQLYDAAKYQQGVDDVIIWDRNGKDGGFWNFLKFIFNFPYKKIFAAFPIYSGDRPIILAKLLGAKFILGEKQNILKHLLKNKYEIKKIGSKTQEQNISLLSGITKEKLTDCPMKYIPPEITSSFIKELENKFGIDYSSTQEEAITKALENNIINPLTQRNMIRSSAAANMYSNLAEAMNDSISDYSAELLANSQRNTGDMINLLMNAYLQGHNAVNGNQALSLQTSAGNATTTGNSKTSGYSYGL